MQLDLAIQKIDAEQRIVIGFASSERLDSQGGLWEGEPYAGDIVDARAIKGALPDFMQWANLRAMHTGPDGKSEMRAVGTVLKAEVIDGDVEVDGQVYKNPLRVVAKVLDDDTWQKVKQGVYKGFSIGGKVLRAITERIGKVIARRITALELNEISLVDRPANLDARIFVFKGAGMDKDTPTTGEADVADPVAALRATAGLQKVAAPDPSKLIAQMQAMRDEMELQGDTEGAACCTQAIALMLEAAGEAQETTPDDEATPEDAAADATQATAATPAGVQMAATAQIKKAGRAISGSRMGAMHNVVKALLQLMAGAGDTQAQKAMAAYTQKDDTPAEDDAAMAAKFAKSVGAELQTALTPFAQALVSIYDLVSRTPVAGGPLVRPVPVAKALPGQAPQPVTASAAQTDPFTKAQLDYLRHLANTEPNPARADAYRKQYEALKAAS